MFDAYTTSLHVKFYFGSDVNDNFNDALDFNSAQLDAI